MDNKIDELIEFYSKLWKDAKSSCDSAKLKKSIKANREIILKETTRKDCYTDFINHLVGLKSKPPTEYKKKTLLCFGAEQIELKSKFDSQDS